MPCGPAFRVPPGLFRQFHREVRRIPLPRRLSITARVGAGTATPGPCEAAVVEVGYDATGSVAAYEVVAFDTSDRAIAFDFQGLELHVPFGASDGASGVGPEIYLAILSKHTTRLARKVVYVLSSTPAPPEASWRVPSTNSSNIFSSFWTRRSCSRRACTHASKEVRNTGSGYFSI